MTEIAEQLSCQELVELVTDYLDGALSPRDRARFDAHIAGTLRPEELAPEAEAALLEAFHDWKRRP